MSHGVASYLYAKLGVGHGRPPAVLACRRHLRLLGVAGGNVAPAPEEWVRWPFTAFPLGELDGDEQQGRGSFSGLLEHHT